MKVNIALVALGLVAPATAQAGLEFCNKTGSSASIAIGYNTADGWTSEGWWNIAAGACKTVISRDLDKTHYYWRAESSDLSWSHANYMFCTSDEVFTIVGDDDCGPRGYDREGFNEIETDGSSSFTMTLTNSGGRQDNTAQGPRDPEEDIVYPDEEYDSAVSDVVSDPPGTHGEPYSITGILSHCDWYDAGLGCTVLADGWSYVASSYDPTPVAILEDLEALGPNVPITISGDMLSYEGTEAFVTIRDYSIGEPDRHQTTRQALQGFWTSEEDANYEILIHGSTYEEFYQQMPDMPLMMHFQTGCPDNPSDAVSFRLVSRDGDEDRCVLVSHVDGSSLELFVAGTMRPLYFQRKN